MDRAQKFGLLLAAVLLNSLGYAAIQWLRPTGVVVTTWVDSLVPFLPIFVIPYALYVPLVLLPFLLLWKDDSYPRMAAGMILCLGISLLVYLVFQTSVLRPEVEVTDLWTWAVSLFYAGDRPLNVYPSLHVSMSLLATLFIAERRPRAGMLLAPLTALVALSTVFIRQHAIVDVAGGIALALAIFWTRKTWGPALRGTGKGGKKAF
ncbi:MAG: phosphatase PAP2 family protein [Candidatus Aenigmarchaeota archaeon]|nr:phosphatase PAP2 family protein [Candidatus Aenigmarchaeota archaeon]